MKRRPVVDRRYWPDGEKNAFSSPSKSDRCVCMPDPGCSMNGLGMKVATSSSRSATSSVARLSRPGLEDRSVNLARRSVQDSLMEDLRRLDPDVYYGELLTTELPHLADYATDK